MVVSYSSEKPNLSFVRINQNTSDGTGPSIKTYITKGLVSSDPFVVNASLLHPSLVAQPILETLVETPFWCNLELLVNTQDGQKELSKSGETVSLNNRLDTTPVACTATSLGATPREVASARPEFKQPLTSVRLPLGVILVKIDSQQPTSTNPPTNNLLPTPPTPPSSRPTTPSSSRPTTPSSSPSLPPTPPTARAAIGIKRKLDDVDEVNYPQIRKINTQSQMLITSKSRSDLIQENQRLEKTNKILADENRELREKLDLLSKILKDPRKRDMLNARLACMQTAAS